MHDDGRKVWGAAGRRAVAALEQHNQSGQPTARHEHLEARGAAITHDSDAARRTQAHGRVGAASVRNDGRDAAKEAGTLSKVSARAHRVFEDAKEGQGDAAGMWWFIDASRGLGRLQSLGVGQALQHVNHGHDHVMCYKSPAHLALGAHHMTLQGRQFVR